MKVAQESTHLLSSEDTIINHLAIYNKNIFGLDYIALMLNGTKTLGIKFSSRKTAPYLKLKDGDTLYLKESSGPVRGRVRVKSVINQELTDPEQVMQFLVDHSQKIGIKDETQLMNIWRQNMTRRYLCYWRMETPEAIHHPVYIQKADRRAWVAGYEPPEEVLIGF